MGQTMVEKILARAAGRETVKPGDIVTVDVGTAVVYDLWVPANMRRSRS